MKEIIIEKLIASSREYPEQQNTLEGKKRKDTSMELRHLYGVSKRTVKGQKQIFNRYNLSRAIKANNFVDILKRIQ